MRLIDADELEELWTGISPGATVHPDSVIDSIDRQPTVPQFGKWISVKDHLPEQYQRVIVYFDNGEIDLAHIADNQWYESSWEVYGVTHWMPLTEPPKDGDSE